MNIVNREVSLMGRREVDIRNTLLFRIYFVSGIVFEYFWTIT